MKKINLNNEKGFALIAVIIVVLLVGMIGVSILVSTSGETILVERNYKRAQALYIAESALNGITLSLKTLGNWDSNIWSNKTTATAPKGTAYITNMSIDKTLGVSSVTVTGSYNGEQRRIRTGIRYYLPGLKGAGNFRAQNPRLNGNAVIDGRNHDRDGNFLNDKMGYLRRISGG